MSIKQYEGLPFFIGTGTKVSTDKLPEVQNAVARRLRGVSEWFDRYKKGRKIKYAISKEEAGAVQNVHMMYAYNAYYKFLHQSLTSLKDTFRVVSNNFNVDVERPTTILKSYLSSLQQQNDLLADDAILYGCAAILLDAYIEPGQEPLILANRVKAAKLVYDFEQPGVGCFTIRVTPELAYKYTFLPEYYRQQLYNKSVADAATVAELRVYIGELVVDDKLDTYLALIYNRRVIYAEKGRDLTYLRAVSINDKNDDCSPIYTSLKASELSRDSYKLIFDYNDEIVNPIKAGPFELSSKAWDSAKITRYLKLPQMGTQLQQLLPGNLDINSLIAIQQTIQTLSQQATGLNEYTLGQATGSVRTLGEAMMLADSASGILNILSNKLKTKLILPVIEDILEIMKITLGDSSDIFDSSLRVDLDIAKDSQEASTLMSLINMPMFGSVVQGLPPEMALNLLRWILEKLHISGTASIFEAVKELANSNITTNTNNRRQQ